MHAVDLTSGASSPVPVAQASEGVFGADSAFYFTRFDFQGSYTKRYKGGTAQGIWRVGRGDEEAAPLTPRFFGTAKAPMLGGGRLYFASDRTAETAEDAEKQQRLGVVNIWSSNLTGGDLRQHTFHTDYDVQSPSIHENRIVYQQGADIWLLDLTVPNPAPRKLDIRLTTDADQLRERWITNPQQYLTSFHVSPNGDRVSIVSRGNVFVAPVGPGRLVHATPQKREQWVRYRGARFMPDGKSLLTLSDESGEVELWRVPANGIGARTKLTKDAKILRWDGLPSPDGKFVAHHDKDQKLWLLDVVKGEDRQISESARMSAWISSAPGFFDMTWSADGRWLAFNDVASNMFGRIALYDTQGGTTTHVTTDRYDSYSPAFTPDGAWLYFLSDRNLVSVVGSPWGMRSPDPYVESPTKLYAVQLKRGAKWPFAPKTELDAPPDTTKKPDAAKATPAAIDLAGVAERLFEVPVPAGSYQSLSTDGTRLYWLTLASRTPFRRNLMTLELKAEAKPETFNDDVAGYELTADRKKLLLRKAQELYVVPAAAKAPASLTEARVDLAGWTLAVDPRAEYAQMFEDAWRLERDYFYDPGMHGVDWPAMREKYRPLVARVTDRNELSDLLAQLVGELSALHIFVRGGDFRQGDDQVLPASLGATLAKAERGWRVDHLYRSDPDIPEEVGPLARPGVDIQEGDVLLAINGTALTSVAHPSELLRNQAGRQVLVRVRAGAGGAERDVIVTPITQSRDADLRYDEWEYTRRQLVDSLSGGKIGYVHIRNMSTAGMTEFMREYYPVFNRAGLIIDVRNNTGGNIDAWLLARLLRQAWFEWRPRTGEPYSNMPYAFRGPMVVLVNERTASDGEAFAEGFRRLKLGRVIGTRTWGGEVWLSSSNNLLDRGIATAAEQGVFDYSGVLLIEGWGVEPDVVVDNLPGVTFTGRDLQWERAVGEVLSERNARQ
jgi:tricorn protease